MLYILSLLFIILKGLAFVVQKQSNQDFWVSVKTKASQVFNNLLSMVRRSGHIPQDEKSGTGMFQSATRRTIGLLTYDSATNQNIQIMSEIYSLEQLIEIDRLNLRMIKSRLDYDKIDNNFGNILQGAKYILNQKNKSTEDMHNEYLHYMWENIQINPSYNRSVSFIFITKKLT